MLTKNLGLFIDIEASWVHEGVFLVYIKARQRGCVLTGDRGKLDWCVYGKYASRDKAVKAAKELSKKHRIPFKEK